MKRFLLPLFLGCSVLPIVPIVPIVPARAQTGLTDLDARLKKFDRLEGTLSATSAGVTVQAKLQFQAPDLLRIEVQKNEGALIAAQVVVASGAETRLFNPDTKRVQRLPYNIARQWWRGAGLQNGGPANVALFGLSAADTSRFYNTTISPAAPGGGTNVALKAREEVGRYLVRDFVRTGGSGNQLFYVAFKRPLLDRSSFINLTLGAGNILASRQENDANGQPSAVMTIASDAASSLPQSATIKDAKGVVLSEFRYNLKPRGEAFAADAFGLEAPGQIVEDQELQPLAAYEAGQDAASRFNLGIALARHSEDFGAAFAAWEQAATLAPQAVAPHLAILDAAISVRELKRAAQALKFLTPLLGENSLEVLSRRAVLAILQRDWAGAQQALDAAQAVQTGNLSITLTRADLQRALGNFAPARGLLQEILKSNATQPATQVAAAEAWAMLAYDPSNAKAGEDALAALPRDTQWQRLARVHLALLLKKEATDSFDNDAALVSFALAAERGGLFDLAQAQWTILLARAPEAARNGARGHLMALAALKGDAVTSLRIYRELVEATVGEAARRSVRLALLEAWRKAFRQESLRAILEQRSIATTATDDDLRLWLTYQETYGTEDEITVAVQSGLARFPDSARWQSRLAEDMADQAATQPFTPTGDARRARLYQEAARAVQRAMALDSKQPYFAVQRALLATQQAKSNSPIVDVGRSVAARTAALKAVDALQAAWPGDPDVQIAVAMQRLSLDAGDYSPSVQLLQKMLREGSPGRESLSGDRHAAVFPARQALASAWRRQKNPDEAARQYEILLQAARDSGEQLGIGINYANLLIAQKNAPAVAALMTRLAREVWSFSQARELSDGLLSTVLRHRDLSPQVAAALVASNDPYARLTAATLYAALIGGAKAAAAAPDAAPETQGTLNQLTRVQAGLSQQIEPLTTGSDKILAVRAAALLGENALNSGDAAKGAGWLQQSLAIEPRDINLRLALAGARRAARQADAAQTDRDNLLHALPLSVDILRRAALLSLQMKRPAEAASLAQQAMNMAQVAPEIAPVQLEAAAFTVARAAFLAQDARRGIELLNNLALAQWPDEDRGAALIELENQLRQAGQINQADRALDQLKALKLSRPQLRQARQFLQSLD